MREQMKLFEATERVEIPGETYVPEFVSTHEERELIRQIERGTWTREFSRRRQHYGVGYGKEETQPSPLPPWIELIARRIVSAGLFSRMPVQALVNEYQPRQGISAHKDYEPFDEVASLSLASGCLMEFAKPNTAEKSIWLEPRSLLVLTGEARHEWTHAIRPRLADVILEPKRPRTPALPHVTNHSSVAAQNPRNSRCHHGRADAALPPLANSRPRRFPSRWFWRRSDLHPRKNSPVTPHRCSFLACNPLLWVPADARVSIANDRPRLRLRS